MVLAHVAVAVARELDDPAARHAAGRRAARGGRRARRARRACASRRRPGAGRSRPRRSRRRSRVEVADLARPPRGARASPPTAPSRPAAPRRRVLCTTSALCSHSAVSSAVPGGREAPRRRLLLAVRAHEHRAGGARPARRRSSAACSATVAPGSSSESSLSSRQKRPARALQQRGCRSPPCRGARAARSPRSSTGWRRATSTEPSCEALSSTSTSVSKSTVARSRAIASRQ